jgi:hypothetical protein
VVRIAAESQSLGFEPLKEESPKDLKDEDLGRIAADHGAVAVIWVNDGTGVKVWVAGTAQEVTVEQAGDQADALLAFKAAELLRASVISLPNDRDKAAPVQKPRPPPQKTAVQPRPSPDQRDASSRLSAALQPAAVFGFGDLPPAFNIGLSHNVRVATRIVIDLGGLIPTFPIKTEIEGGVLQVTEGVIRGGVRFALVPLHRRVVPFLSVFAGGLILKASGSVDSKHNLFPNLFGAAVVGGSFAIAFNVTKIIKLRLDTEAGTALPTPVFLNNGQDVASFGMPLVAVLFGVEVRLL